MIYKKLYNQRINNNYALLCDVDNKCNLEMVKFKINPVRFILFDIYDKLYNYSFDKKVTIKDIAILILNCIIKK